MYTKIRENSKAEKELNEKNPLSPEDVDSELDKMELKRQGRKIYREQFLPRKEEK